MKLLDRFSPQELSPIRHLNVNLSGKTFSDSDTFGELVNVIDRIAIAPERLHFEITEEKTGVDILQLRYFMESLTQRGFCFALDDFGTGFANIARLLSLPLSTIKVDKSILNASKKIMEDTLVLLSNSNCKIIVEGVETQAQIDWVKTLPVDEVQGFYYALPMPEKDFLAFIKRINGRSE